MEMVEYCSMYVCVCGKGEGNGDGDEGVVATVFNLLVKEAGFVQCIQAEMIGCPGRWRKGC